MVWFEIIDESVWNQTTQDCDGPATTSTATSLSTSMTMCMAMSNPNSSVYLASTYFNLVPAHGHRGVTLSLIANGRMMRVEALDTGDDGYGAVMECIIIILRTYLLTLSNWNGEHQVLL